MEQPTLFYHWMYRVETPGGGARGAEGWGQRTTRKRGRARRGGARGPTVRGAGPEDYLGEVAGPED